MVVLVEHHDLVVLLEHLSLVVYLERYCLVVSVEHPKEVVYHVPWVFFIQRGSSSQSKGLPSQ